MFYYDIYGSTCVGKIRARNEDHILVGRFVKNRGAIRLGLRSDDDHLHDYGVLLAVTDGIGGHNGGEKASKLALYHLDRSFHAEVKPEPQSYRDGLERAAQNANQVVREVAGRDATLANMGCTLSGVCLMPEGFCVFNVGDSRVYRFRNGMLKPLTRDDTVAAAAIRRGDIDLEQAKRSEQSHILTNYVGSQNFRITVESGPELRDRDIVLVCSDGIYDMIDDDTLESELTRLSERGAAVDEKGERLVGLACDNGGRDNISLLILAVRDVG